MQELIKIERKVLGAEEVNSVNARDIHEYLRVKTKFADWIKRAIKKYDFIENEDYLVLKNEKQVHNQMRISYDYIVTIDMAKELSMLENNKKGKETRKYFIAMEKKAISAGDNSQIFAMLSELTKSVALLASAVNENTKITDEGWCDVVMRVYSVDERLYRVNIDDTLSTDMLDGIRARVTARAKSLSKKHDIPVQDMTRLIYGKLNTKFGVDTYYKIYFNDFIKALYFIDNLRLNLNSGGVR